MLEDPLVMNIIMLIISTLLGGVIGFQVFIFKSINALKEDLNRLELKITSDYSKKDDLNQLIDRLETHIEKRMNDHFKLLTHQLQREIRK